MSVKQRTRKRRSARALAIKVWNVMVPNNNSKDQTKSSADSSGDDGHTVSGTCKETSVQSQSMSADDHSESTVDPNNDMKDVDEDRRLAPPRGLVEMHTSENDNDNDVSIDTNSEAQQLPKPITITTHQQYKPDKLGSALSELDKENTSQLQTATPNDVARNEREDILLLSSSTTKKAQQYITADQQVANTTSDNKDNNCSDVIEVNDASFVEGTAVSIIKGTHQGKRGVISRVTNKFAFISIDKISKDVKKTKSSQFLAIIDTTQNKEPTNNDLTPAEETKDEPRTSPQKEQDKMFVKGTSVRIKRGTYRDRQGIITRTTDKCVYVSIHGLDKDVRKSKSEHFLEIMMFNDDKSRGSQQEDCASTDRGVQRTEHVLHMNEANNESVYVSGTRVNIVKGKFAGHSGIISRVTSKVAFVSIEGVKKDVRKTKSDQFLQEVDSS
jgi:ribosomal protein L24